MADDTGGLPPPSNGAAPNPYPRTEGDAILHAIQAIEAEGLVIHNICHMPVWPDTAYRFGPAQVRAWRANVRDEVRWEFYDAGTLLGALQGVLARWRAGEGPAKALYRGPAGGSGWDQGRPAGADDLDL